MVVGIYMGLGKTQRNKREIFLPDNRNNHNNETAITYTIHVLYHIPCSTEIMY